MTEIFVERSRAPQLTDEDIWEMLATGIGCFKIHRVGWYESMLSMDGNHLLCHFAAPDAGSVRIALRHSGVSFDTLGTGPGK